MKIVMKIQFDKGEKQKLIEIIEKCDLKSQAVQTVQREMGATASAANTAVERFWRSVKP